MPHRVFAVAVTSIGQHLSREDRDEADGDGDDHQFPLVLYGFVTDDFSSAAQFFIG